MLSTWALIVCSLSPDCLSACSKPSRIGWFASCIVWTRCSYVSASSASLMEPLSFSFPLFLSQVSSRCQDRLAILEKNARDRLIAWASTQPSWAIGFLDEVWWSRFALPRMHAWQDEDHPVRLVEQSWQKGDPDPKALACYGVLWQEGTPDDPKRDQMWLRFVTGRPVSAITIGFLDWCCERLAAQGKRNWLLIWDNASWHKSLMVRTWIREHNQQVKQTGKGVRILPFLLPTQSPWLNPIEPKWVHAKRNVVEHDGVLTARQLAERVCAYFGCSYESHLAIPEKVA